MLAIDVRPTTRNVRLLEQFYEPQNSVFWIANHLEHLRGRAVLSPGLLRKRMSEIHTSLSSLVKEKVKINCLPLKLFYPNLVSKVTALSENCLDHVLPCNGICIHAHKYSARDFDQPTNSLIWTENLT